jgi:hypothetical protein
MDELQQRRRPSVATDAGLLLLVRSQHVVGRRAGCRNDWRSRSLDAGREVSAPFARDEQCASAT